MSSTGITEKYLDGLNSREMLLKLSWDAWLAIQPPYTDGKFTTERLLPGEYKLIAEAYLPEKPQERLDTGIRLPRFIGAVKVTVPKEGKAEPVVIKLEKSKR